MCSFGAEVSAGPRWDKRTSCNTGHQRHKGMMKGLDVKSNCSNIKRVVGMMIELAVTGQLSKSILSVHVVLNVQHKQLQNGLKALLSW